MRKAIYLVLILTSFSTARLWAAGNAASCGDDHMVCGTGETCCEHEVAFYSPNGVQGTAQTEGQCLPAGQKCGQFWCGPKHCEGGFWGDPKVCCIDPRQGAVPDYQCARTELNCPGNTQLLTIRDNPSERS
jgi:hypothetical protein